MDDFIYIKDVISVSPKLFQNYAARPECPHWDKLISRLSPMQLRPGEMRSEFGRDYTRILHSNAYRRLKHKTQVFLNIENDHICTRMEHVAHVESVSNTIATELGLNTELTKAIAIGHDLGHAPFGHLGERIIKELRKKHLNKDFWHEQNGLYFVDKIELLKNEYNQGKNLNLTYAVRDGIICHCGEVDENQLRPRKDFIDLNSIVTPGQVAPVTWEGCIVKVSDKIAYVGRDIEDAKSLGFLDKEEQKELNTIFDKVTNTTVIMYELITDICQHSNPQDGIRLSHEMLAKLDAVKAFNYKYIYTNPRLTPYNNYATLIVNEIFNFLMQGYNSTTNAVNWNYFQANAQRYPELVVGFTERIIRYCNAEILDCQQKGYAQNYQNLKIYGNMDRQEIYIQAVLDYISGMTDRFAIAAFNELLTFKK